MAPVANDIALSDVLKIIVGVVLLSTWVGLRIAHTDGAEDIITFCQTMLTALGSHYLTVWKIAK